MALNELAAQRLILDSVRAYDGFGFKLSNKFLGGIPDLFLKPKGYAPSIFEVKIRDRTVNSTDSRKLHVTPLQQMFLRDYHNAGGICGVISVLRGKTEIYVCVSTYEMVSYGDDTVRPWYISRAAHTMVPRGERHKTIYELFIRGAYGTQERPADQS